MNRNYQKELEQILKCQKEEGVVPKLLLHSCCAPCSSYVIEYLSSYFNITVFYYNPNIYPDEEYEKRVEEQMRFIREFPTKYPVEFIRGDFEKERFYDAVKGFEQIKEGGERCFRCYELRLSETARLAKEIEADYFTTTLSISPLKNAAKLNEIGERLAKEYAVSYLVSDFKKKNGYKRSVELSNAYGMYRQDYCGCVFSKQEREAQRKGE
ncbi:MAG: epoxyqueuosine reductase QueH [Lachnospiraceae bacterium]|nr:epoxyqueuosine reductase QueH [Lachnospiraceae bacterium]